MYGHITFTEKTVDMGAGGSHRTIAGFKVDGGPIFCVSKRLLDQCGYTTSKSGDAVSIGPVRLRLLKYDSCLRGWEVVLDKWTWRFHAGLYWATGWLRVLKARLIATASVWGLAWYEDGRLLDWSDVHVVRWLGWAAENCGAVDPRDWRRGFSRG